MSKIHYAASLKSVILFLLKCLPKKVNDGAKDTYIVWPSMYMSIIAIGMYRTFKNSMKWLGIKYVVW